MSRPPDDHPRPSPSADAAEPVLARPDQKPEGSSRSSEAPLPDDVLCIVPVRNIVLFPGQMPLALGRAKSIAAAQEAARSERPIGVLLQRVPAVDDPTPDQLYEVGCVAGILRYVTAPDGNHHVVCQGQQRFRVREFVPGYPFIAARVERFEERDESTPEIEARFFHLRSARRGAAAAPQVPPS